MGGVFSVQDLWLFDISIDKFLTFKFGNDVMILKMEICNKDDYIDIESLLIVIASTI